MFVYVRASFTVGTQPSRGLCRCTASFVIDLSLWSLGRVTPAPGFIKNLNNKKNNRTKGKKDFFSFDFYHHYLYINIYNFQVRRLIVEMIQELESSCIITSIKELAGLQIKHAMSRNGFLVLFEILSSLNCFLTLNLLKKV